MRRWLALCVVVAAMALKGSSAAQVFKHREPAVATMVPNAQPEAPLGESVAEQFAKNLKDYPDVPVRAPLKLSKAERDKLQTTGVYFWTPDNRDRGNLNELGFDTVDKTAEDAAAKMATGERLDKLHQAQLALEDMKRESFEAQALAEAVRGSLCSCPSPCAGPCPATSPSPALLQVSQETAPAQAARAAQHQGPQIIKGTSKTTVPGPVSFAPPIPFPGDGGEPLTCHTPVETRKYLDFVGVDHAEERGIHLRTAAYTNLRDFDTTTPETAKLNKMRVVQADEWDDESDRGAKLDGFHFFAVHGGPNRDQSGRKCYDPSVPYAETLDMIGPDSQEVKWGCTPFRLAARELQQAVACARKEVGHKFWSEVEEDVLHDLAFEAQRQDPKRWKDALRHRIVMYFNSSKSGVPATPTEEEQLPEAEKSVQEAQKEAKHPFEAKPLRKEPPIAILDDERSPEVLKREKESTLVAVVDVLSDCFRNQQRALMCQPVMAGSSGMQGHGLKDHSKDWILDSTKILKTCKVPDACVRLGVEQLLHFHQKQYQRVMPQLLAVTKPLWNKHCRPDDSKGPWFDEISGGNCRLYSSCLLESMRRLCSVAPECCPSSAVHMECMKNVTGPGCTVCSAYDPNDGFRG